MTFNLFETITVEDTEIATDTSIECRPIAPFPAEATQFLCRALSAASGRR